MPLKNPLRSIQARLSAARERHRTRHSASGFQFLLSDSIGFLRPDHWDFVTGGRRFFLRRPVLEAIERHRPENLSPRYALIYRDGTPVAAMAAQMIEISGSQVLGPSKSGETKLLRKAASVPARRLAARIGQRALIAGNAMSWGFDGVAFAPDTDPATAWGGVAEALYRIRRADQLNGPTDLVLVKDITPSEPHAEALRSYSYRPLETEPNMVLTLDPGWRSYEDYLGALDAKYRRNARDQVKKLAEAGCVIEPIAEVGAYGSELHRLYKSVQGQATVKLVSVPPTYLPALAEAAPQDVRCSVVRRGDDLLGFISTIRDGETAIGYYIGFDREVASTGVPLYLRLLHTTVADAIGWGCRRLSLGRTALEPKAALGAKPETMSVWLRHRNPAVNWLVRGLLDAVPHAEPPDRNPFKGEKTPKALQPGS